MNVKLIYESFTPRVGEEFYYKPSKEWNHLVWCDFKYTDYFYRVYNEIPPRINPVKLHLVGENDEVVVSDFKTDSPCEVIQKILDSGGNCEIKKKKEQIFLKGYRLKGR